MLGGVALDLRWACAGHARECAPVIMSARALTLHWACAWHARSSVHERLDLRFLKFRLTLPRLVLPRLALYYLAPPRTIMSTQHADFIRFVGKMRR